MPQTRGQADPALSSASGDRPARRLGSGYPTKRFELRLDSTDGFKEFPHPAVREMVVGVTPTSGLGSWRPFIRWPEWGADAVVVDVDVLSGQWQSPGSGRTPGAPVEMRFTEPDVVEVRFLDPGPLATGAAPLREQQSVAPPTAGQVGAMAQGQHADRMGVINRTRG